MTHLLLAVIYIAFVSLGLPDAILGAAWPTMYPQFGVSVSYMGILSFIISGGTVLSSLNAHRLTKRFGTGVVTAASVALTALALLGFSWSNSFWMLALWAIPYGLGAGAVDASINNYVAIHYASRHMSWLHCMWGVGACTGPYVMGYVLAGGASWGTSYRYIGIFQVVLSLILISSLPLWKRGTGEQKAQKTPRTMREILATPGVREILVGFFCYCALEATAGQWASSYFVMKDGVSPEEAASLASLFYIGMTVGRAVSGFLTIRFSDKQMIRLGQAGIGMGIAVMLLPLGRTGTVIGLVLAGLGCAPIYPCIIHSTPDHFVEENSQGVIGLQMAGAYTGSLTMPPLFGLLADFVGAELLPAYLLVILVLMVLMVERLNRIGAGKSRRVKNN